MVGLDASQCNNVITLSNRNYLGSPSAIRSRRIWAFPQAACIVGTPRVDSWEHLLRLPRDKRFFVTPPLESFCCVRIHRSHHK